MFGLTTLGVFHTAIAVIAVVGGFAALARYGRIEMRSRAGLVFFWGTVVVVVAT